MSIIAIYQIAAITNVITAELQCYVYCQVTWMCTRVIQYTNSSVGGVEQIVSYLPLSHIASQLVDIYFPMASAGTVWFAQPDAMKV